jgi:hypothetical protein
MMWSERRNEVVKGGMWTAGRGHERVFKQCRKEADTGEWEELGTAMRLVSKWWLRRKGNEERALYFAGSVAAG